MSAFLIFGVIGFGLWLVMYSAWRAIRSWKTHSWPKTEVVFRKLLVSAREQYGAGETGPLPVYFPEVEYEYSVRGSAYVGKRILRQRLGAEGFSARGAELLKSDVATRKQCFYNPDSPGESVLIPGLSRASRSRYLALTLAGVLLVAAGVATWELTRA